jgi:hypothetical protein
LELGSFVVAITRKDTPPCSSPPIHNFQLYLPTVAVKAVLISFDFSSRSNPYYQKRCEQLATLGRVIREDFAERSHSSKSLQRAGHPKWRDVDLNEDLGIWKRDACSQPAKREPAIETKQDLVKALTEILKGKRPSR